MTFVKVDKGYPYAPDMVWLRPEAVVAVEKEQDTFESSPAISVVRLFCGYSYKVLGAVEEVMSQLFGPKGEEWKPSP